MQPLQRTALRSARHLRPQLQRHLRRNASDHHGSSSHDSHGAHHAGPANESFGSGFYITLAAIPVSFAIYKFTAQGTSEQPYITRLIRNTYDGYKTTWADRNDLHTQAVEQAAADRVLFLNESSRNVRHVNLRYPEIVNASSPWNVPAGQGYTNIDGLIAKYEKEAFAANEEKRKQLRENRVAVEQPLQPLAKATPAALDS